MGRRYSGLDKNLDDFSEADVYKAPDYDSLNDLKETGKAINSNISTIILMVLIPVIAVATYFGYNFYQKHSQNKNHGFVPPVVTQKEENQEEQVSDNTINGYTKLGNLVIEKIELNEVIIDPVIDNVPYTEDALNYGVVKLYGNEINEIGNFCMMAHNTSRFARLKELQVGDEFKVLDEKDEEMNYKVTEIMHVNPDDLTALLSNEDETEITLITCEEGATTRLIVKAINN